MIGVLMLLIMVGGLVIWAVGNQETEATRETKFCKLHSWCWDEVKEQRFCTKCGLIAGSVTTENGDY
jgi:hypothetical protein